MADGLPDDYYALFGVEPDVKPAALRRAWRVLALRWHPDRAGPAATATFQKLAVAYEVLSDPVARAEYDRSRPRAVKPVPVAPPERAPGEMLWRVSGSLKALLATGIVKRAEPDVLELSLAAKEAEQGGMVTISMRVPVRCLACNGKAKSCVRCGGEGAVYQLFNAWLAVPPGIPDGAVLHPTELLRGMIHPMRFRIRVRTGN